MALFSITLKAQVPLPYYSGFDNATQKAGWTEYKKGATTFSHWGNSGGGYSAPNGISHDYSPSTGITLTDNWYVSPAFSITNGGRLDSIRYKFYGMSVPAADDTIAIYLLNGSQNPSLASSKTLLVDFRNTDFINDYVYKIKTNINLTASNGLSYIAIRYRNTNCSSKWLTVSFDNIAISGNTVGINELDISSDQVNIYPNPTTGKVIIDSKHSINSIEIYNLLGENIYSNSKFNLQTSNEIDLSNFPKGIYFVKIYDGTKTYKKKIVVQ